MSEPFLGEIRMVGFNFAPRGWAFCAGQLMSIAQNTALFSLLGTTYGGDGRVTFGLPDYRGRAPMSFGQGPGLTNRVQGEASGSETVTLISSEMPMHNHLVNANNSAGAVNTPNGSFLAGTARGAVALYAATSDGSVLAPQSVGLAGGNQPHNNLQPYLVVNFVIALQGIFPSRS
jgi:microcystin-dependent protein